MFRHDALIELITMCVHWSTNMHQLYADDDHLLEKLGISLVNSSRLWAGIGRYMARVWYRKKFEPASNWKGSRVMLHFGAVDWRSQVFINGEEMGIHTGGYDKVSHASCMSAYLSPNFHFEHEFDTFLHDSAFCDWSCKIRTTTTCYTTRAAATVMLW